MSNLHPAIDGPFINLESGLYSSAHWIWERRKSAKETGFPFTEETITETVLLDFACALSDVIHVIPFSKPKEGQTGADWEWCFLDHTNSRYLRFLVQAKVLDIRDNVYAHIDRYIGNSGVRQIDRLAKTSRDRGVPAIYAFYNHLDDESRLRINHCPCYKCVKCWGATVAPLNAVMSALPDKGFDTLRDISVPWVCLVCAENTSSSKPDPINRVISALRRLDGIARDRIEEGDHFDLPPFPIEPEQQAPDYLEPLIGVSPDDGLRAQAIEVRDKIAQKNPGLDGVVIVDVSSDVSE